MSEQDGIQPSTKQRRSRKKNTTNQQNDKQAPATQRPANEDAEAWKAYWKAQDQPWRTEPEINTERQQYLDQRRSIKPDTEKGTYPFKGLEPKLTRADIEWLLATHESGRGPVDWRDESQREREGLDLRGAYLQGLDLSSLPLAKLNGGLNPIGEVKITDIQRKAAAIHLEDANLNSTHLEGAELSSAYLQNADISLAHVDNSRIVYAHMENSNIVRTSLKQADLIWSHLEGVSIKLSHLEGANLFGTHLQGAELFGVFFDAETWLNSISIADKQHGPIFLYHIHWGDANLSLVDWSSLLKLGNESIARQSRTEEGKLKTEQKRLQEYMIAERAYRQLAVVLRNQGINEDAARFVYRAQLMQRKVFWHQRKFRQYIFSLFLDLLTGYGYRPERSFIAYALAISIFATIYLLLGNHLAWNEAIVISMTAFHGRGFFPDQFHPGDPQALVAAIEAFVGLLIEVTFIATLTQRLFGK